MQKFIKKVRSLDYLILLFFLCISCSKEKIKSIQIEKDKHNQYRVRVCTNLNSIPDIRDYSLLLSYQKKNREIYTCKHPYPIQLTDRSKKSCFTVKIDSCPDSLNPQPEDLKFVESFELKEVSGLRLLFTKKNNHSITFLKELSF